VNAREQRGEVGVDARIIQGREKDARVIQAGEVNCLRQLVCKHSTLSILLIPRLATIIHKSKTVQLQKYTMHIKDQPDYY